MTPDKTIFQLCFFCLDYQFKEIRNNKDKRDMFKMVQSEVKRLFFKHSLQEDRPKGRDYSPLSRLK